MDALIQTYSYYNSAGTRPNREIQFFRGCDGKPESIYAVVKGLRSGVWYDISRLDKDQIKLEMMSTSDKIKGLLAERREKEGFEIIQDKRFSELSVEKQDQILHSLGPNGSYRLDITNRFGDDLRFEKVVDLTIFKSL